MKKRKVIITTPDYPPKLGGLSSFSRNLYELLCQMNLDVEIFEWSAKSLISKSRLIIPEADLYIHVHFMGGLLGNFPRSKSINFCHGSEILFTSPNPILKIIKKLGKFRGIKYFEESLCNFFISNFTKNKLSELGLRTHYGRDFILHNNIPVKEILEIPVKSYGKDGRIQLCSIARDVPHKNLNDSYMFCLYLHKLTNLQIDFFVTSDRFTSKVGVEVHSLVDKTDDEISEVYKKSDLNLLLSKDNSLNGFFEGFGLTILEAAQYAVPSVVSSTGGLPENVHHLFNGYVLNTVDEKSVDEFNTQAKENYSSWSTNSYQHLNNSHSMDLYKRVFTKLLEGRDE